MGFNTCSSCEEQLLREYRKLGDDPFQYMLLLRGATCGLTQCGLTQCVSIHAPLARSNGLIDHIKARQAVSIHAPLARSNFRFKLWRYYTRVSIHAPLARSNTIRNGTIKRLLSFQYMLLLRGATARGIHVFCAQTFQYMLLLRGATAVLCNIKRNADVSIHAPLARSNSIARLQSSFCTFQYMLLLRGATMGLGTYRLVGRRFQYMLLLRGATVWTG